MKPSPRARLVACSVAAVAAVTLVAACGDDDAATTTSAAATTDATTGSTTVASSVPEGTTDGSAATTPDDGSVSDDVDDYTDALAANLKMEDRDLATCISAAVVEEIGFDDIQASGLSPAAFARGDQLEEKGLTIPAEQAGHLQTALAACGDIAEAFISSEEAPDAQKECERGIMTNDLAAEILATQLTGAQPSEDLLAAQEQASACLETAASTTTGG